LSGVDIICRDTGGYSSRGVTDELDFDICWDGGYHAWGSSTTSSGRNRDPLALVLCELGIEDLDAQCPRSGHSDRLKRLYLLDSGAPKWTPKTGRRSLAKLFAMIELGQGNEWRVHMFCH
jgi:hypothetical protein